MEVMRNEYNVPFGKLGGKRPLGRSRRRWKDNIKINLKEVECQNVNLIQLDHDRIQTKALENTVINIRFPLKAVN
jgi:hypothetical protein